MEHSHAIMEDAGNAIDAAAAPSLTNDNDDSSNANIEKQPENTDNSRKRKYPNSRLHFGRSNDNDKRRKKGDMGRADREQPDKRQKTNESREKRLEGNGPNYGAHFSKEEIDAEARRKKNKVAVMIGYSGTGYKGMQISPSEKTIEGDLFKAFVAAGAISKANADDPKKSSFVRCARTDKGVHAAGNMISLKLIVEDEDIIDKINANLNPQIRVWGIEKTIGSFSCYQSCDSRWYEYLIPSYAFLPPHPSSWLAKQLGEIADEAGNREGYDGRQQEVEGFWAGVDQEFINPLLETIDEDIRFDVIRALQGEDEARAVRAKTTADESQPIRKGSSLGGQNKSAEMDGEKTEEAAIILNEPAVADNAGGVDEIGAAEDFDAEVQAEEDATALDSSLSDHQLRLRAATKQIRTAYTTAKRQYRIPSQRLDRIQTALDQFKGTHNYHNYTVQKRYNDASANRHIKSFVVNKTPILIGEGPDAEKSEWLSLKVHGQSFMMHQIRKMIGMVALLVRCGGETNKVSHSFGEAKYSIPKVPGLGLLLERPVFDQYNEKHAPKHGREKLEFGKYEKEMLEFKEREIYQRIFREEEKGNEFAKFFNHIDNFKESYFLFVSSKGLGAVKGGGR